MCKLIEQIIIAEDIELETKLVLRCSCEGFKRFYSLFEVTKSNKEEQHIITYSADLIFKCYNQNIKMVGNELLAKSFGRYTILEDIEKIIYNEAIFNRCLKPLDTGSIANSENESALKVIVLLQNWLLSNIGDNRVGIINIRNKQFIAIKSTAMFKEILNEIGFNNDGISILKLLKDTHKLICDNPNKYCNRYAKTLSGRECAVLGISNGSHVVIPIFEDTFINFYKERKVG